MARSRRSRPGAGQQPLFTTAPPEPAQPPPAEAPAQAPTEERAEERAEERHVDATVLDLPGVAAVRSLRAGLGDDQVQLLPTDPTVFAPPAVPSVPAPAASAPAGGPLRYGRWRLDGPVWELHAALAALRRDTLTGRDLRRRLAELDAQPQAPAPPQARPQPQARRAGAGGEAGSARG